MAHSSGMAPVAAERASKLALGVGVAAFAITAIGVGIGIRWSVEVMPHAVLVATLYPAIGTLIVRQHQRNTIGWLLIGIGFNNGLVVITNVWAPVALDVAPGSLPFGEIGGQIAAWFADGIWILSHGALVALVPLLFPDGKLPSKRWRFLLAFNVLAISVQFAAPLSVLSQVRLRSSFYEFYPDERLAGRLGLLGYRMVTTGAVLAAVALFWRLRRMRRDERGPYVWFAVASVAAVVLLVPFELIPSPIAQEVTRVASVIMIPVGAAVAILHRRAYGIDVVVNRTLVYAALTALLGATFLLAVALVELFVSASSTFSAVVAAGATALALSPLRHHLQRAVNRLLYGSRDEPHVVASTVTTRLEAVAGGVDTLTAVAQEIAQAFRLDYVALEAETSDGARTLAASGTAGPHVERVPLIAHGNPVGSLVAGSRRGQDQLTSRDREALRQVAPIAAVAVHQVQLTDDLQRARGRLAAALEEERRRIRRDLHDGLGPSLASVVMGLEEALAVHRCDPERTERLLADLKTQTRSAVDDIRALVYGLRPPALDELGLAAAVRQLADTTIGRTSIDVDLDVPADLPPLTAATEVAAYRIVQEALTNVVRHSGATRAGVTLAVDQDALVVEVCDDGRGLPTRVTPGVGITSLRERAEDIGGRVAWTNGTGTTVRAELPLHG